MAAPRRVAPREDDPRPRQPRPRPGRLARGAGARPPRPAARAAPVQRDRARGAPRARRHGRVRLPDRLSFLPPEVYEEHYLASADPHAGSGFGGDEARWEAARRPIVEAIDRDGSFLDVGCANGLLLESIVAWSPYRIEPYGLDFSPRLVELARRRLPQWADRIYLGDALEW